jgi:hypothetical protein
LSSLSAPNTLARFLRGCSEPTNSTYG